MATAELVLETAIDALTRRPFVVANLLRLRARPRGRTTASASPDPAGVERGTGVLEPHGAVRPAH